MPSPAPTPKPCSANKYRTAIERFPTTFEPTNKILDPVLDMKKAVDELVEKGDNKQNGEPIAIARADIQELQANMNYIFEKFKLLMTGAKEELMEVTAKEMDAVQALEGLHKLLAHNDDP